MFEEKHFAVVLLSSAFVSLDTDSYPKGPEIFYNPV